MLELVRILVPGLVPAAAATAGMGLLFGAALPLLPRRMVPLVAALGLAALAVAAWRGDWRALLDGLDRGAVFVAFFGTLIVLRATAERRPETARAQTLFAALRAGQRSAATLYGAHLIGSVLVVGAHSLLSPVYGARAPEAVRYPGAIAAQRGIGLAGLWSPFWVAMAIAYQHLPDVPLWAVMALGLGLALPGLLIGQAMESGRPRWDGLAALAPLVPSVLIAAATVVSLTSFTALAPLEALVTGIPVLCLAALAPLGRRRLAGALRATGAGSGSILGELVLITCAFMLGSALAGLLAEIEAAGWLGRNMPPVPAVIAAVIAATTLLSLIGIHQIVTITALLVVLVEVPSGVADLVLMEAALVAWGFSAMVGLSAVSTVAAAALFGLRVERVAWGPNVGFCAVFGLFATAALWAVNSWAA